MAATAIYINKTGVSKADFRILGLPGQRKLQKQVVVFVWRNIFLNMINSLPSLHLVDPWVLPTSNSYTQSLKTAQFYFLYYYMSEKDIV